MKVKEIFKGGLIRTCVAASLFIVPFATQSMAQKVLATVPMPPSVCGGVAVNPSLNRIYVSGGASKSQKVFVLNGATFKGGIAGAGSGASVDSKTGNYWAATVYGGTAIVRTGSDNLEVATVPTSDGCPISTAIDEKARRAWVITQCGESSDPVFAFDADRFTLIHGPIFSGGVMGPAVVNPATGMLYIGPSGASRRVDPKTFEVTTNAFGVVESVDPVSNKLYAIAGNTFEIIDGKPDPEVIAVKVSLDYSPSGVAVNHALHHLYLSNSAKSCIEVRESSSGALVTTFPLAPGANPGSIGVDPTRGRLYVLAAGSEKNLLYVINDNLTHQQILKK
ncbi:MAG: YncE family protein [Terracidiphilus sp.]